jgi:hypothetical protein
MRLTRLLLLLSLIIIAPSIQAEINLQQRAALISSSDWIIKQAFINQKSGLQVQDIGIVIKVLSDDLNGDRHQRFILRLTSGQTLLIAHNIDIAPRLSGLKVNDSVSFYGQYEWNSQGGTVHWTHHDPSKKHINGWLKYKGKTYQ